jgi:hypothetical protein
MSDLHLSHAQMESMLAGAPDEEMELHLEHCELCREEVETIRAVLGDLKVTMAVTAEREWQSAVLRERKEIPQWAWAGALAVLMIGLMPFATTAKQHRGATPVPAQEPAAQVTLSDDALLNGIQKDIATSVPEPLEPLDGTATTSYDNAVSGEKTP